jgi:Rhodopirellula transposase DDE domain
LEENFLRVLREFTAGDPMRTEVRWTNLTTVEISKRLGELGTPAGRRVVQQLLKRHDYVKRKARKSKTMGHHRDRDAQFQNIARLKEQYRAAGLPIVSIDTKKKERLGNFYRDGRLFTREPIIVNDHDFASSGDGVIIPHGLYDVERNRGHINLGLSHDTSEFACDSVAHWWELFGQESYLQATQLLLLCDGGGSNSATRYVFKEGLQKLADRLDLEIRVAHYPPYCSKYNPIEHRMFPHVSRACQGVVFETVSIVQQLMERPHTAQGLKVTVDVMDQVYETGHKAAADFKQTMKLIFDDFLPKWNYRAIPSSRL